MRLRLWLIVAVVLIVILLLGNVGLVALITTIYKDSYVKGDTILSNAKGQVVGTRAATHNLPLLVAPVLPDNELFSVETIHFKLPTIKAINASPNGTGGGEVGLSGAANSLRISVRVSRVEKVNSTAVVFYGLGGEEIRVWNGVTTARLSAAGAETPICAADVTCAAFQVEGAELAEKYLAEAEAQLEPFAERRRRLMACEEPSSKSLEEPTVGLVNLHALIEASQYGNLHSLCADVRSRIRVPTWFRLASPMVSVKMGIEEYPDEPTPTGEGGGNKYQITCRPRSIRRSRRRRR